MSTLKKRNGTIELMRFVFAFMVILYHINNRLNLPYVYHLSFFKNGKIGVEFFFIVSGFLMAMSAKKQLAQTPLTLSNSTKHFMFKKFNAILPYHLLAYFFCLAMTLFFMAKKGPLTLTKTFLMSLPNLFLLQKSGIDTKEILTPEWYIGAMLWMMLIIYPLILKFKDTFTKIACPVIAVIMLGYMTHLQGKLGGASRFVFGETIPKAYARAFAEMCGGVFCYEVVQFIKRLHYTKFERVLLTGVELVSYALPILYAASEFNEKYEIYAFYGLTIAVTLSFSELTLTSQITKNKLFYWLGKFSLPLYLAQSVPFILLKYSHTVKALGKPDKIVFCIALSLISALVLQLAGKYLGKYFNKLTNQKLGRQYVA